MRDKYIIKHKDKSIGELYYNEEADKFSAFIYDTTEPNYVPFILKERGDIVVKNVEDSDVRSWLSDRVISRYRRDCERILKAHGLKEYDMWALIKKNHGFSMGDAFWLAKDEYEKWSDYNKSM